jgi:hypothetical protein
MAILEIGINFGLKSLVELKYYNSSDKVLDPNIRVKFLTGVQDYISEVYNDKMNVISFSDFKFVFYYKKLQTVDNVFIDPLLTVFAIIEQGTDPDFVIKHLKKIAIQFLNLYNIDDLISKTPEYFEPFEKNINKILGDLRFKIKDRIGTLFR